MLVLSVLFTLIFIMFACPICKDVVRDTGSLRIHFSFKHKEALKHYPLDCGQLGCARAFDDFDALKKHLKTCTFPANEIGYDDSMECSDNAPIFENATECEQFIDFFECDTSENVLVDVYDNCEDEYPVKSNELIKDKLPVQSMKFCKDRKPVMNALNQDKQPEKINDSSNDSSSSPFVVNDNPSHVENVSGNQDFGVLEQNALLFISEFYANPDISRATVQNIVEGASSLVSQNLSMIDSLVNKLYESSEMSDSALSQLKSALNAVSNPFKGLETEHLRFKSLLKSGALVKPETFVCGRKGVTSMTGQYFRLEQTLSKFFELPGVLESVQAYVKSLEDEIPSGVVSNFIQAEYWQSKSEEFVGKFVLPIFMHFDDLELGNPLGSHNNIHKLGSVTAQCPCLPPEYVSLLENYFPVLLFHSSDRCADDPLLEVSNNKVIFNKVIEELNGLRTHGISVQTKNGPIQMYFDLGLILGDNLGLHSILGLVESFTANFPCMYCKMSKSETESCCHENCTLIRNVDNYNADLALNDVSLTGLKENCVFNDVNGFHMTTNYSVDLMHDAFEGFCRYNLVEILYYFVFIQKLFSLEFLNNLICSHDYGDVSNKPPLISENDLKSGSIRMSAHEMLIFILHLPSIIGHLIPEDDPYWELFLTMYDIIGFLLCTSIRKSLIPYLNYLITRHLSLYVELLGKTLKNKHHHLLHYCRIIRMSGPPVHYWGMHYESRHRLLKRYGNVCFSRVNISLSVAIKLSLNTAFRFLSKKGFCKRVSMSSVCVPMDQLGLERVYSKEVVSCFKCPKVMFSPKSVKCNGIKYTCGTCLVLSIDQHGLPEFCMIDKIISSKRGIVHFIVNKVPTVSFNRHLRSYNVCKTDQFQFIAFSSLPWPRPVFFHKATQTVSLYHAL